MRAAHRLCRSERGAIFVQVGVALFVLMGLSVFVVDQGVMWIARGQAQNAADAAALAAAVTRGFDDFATPPPSNGTAAQTARAVAALNPVWQAAPVVDVSFDCPGGAPGRCVRVDVFRDSAHSNPISTLFGPILGITNQNVRAMATAQLRAANATDCLRPLAFADDWTEQTGNTEFNKYDAAGNPLSGPQDVYIRPTSTVAGTRTVAGDLGERISWELDQPTLTTAPITRQMVVAVRLPSGIDFYDRIKHCSHDTIQVGQTLPVEIPTVGSAAQGFDWLISQDRGATWNEGQHRVETTCVPGCGNITPRLIAVALYDPDKFQQGRATGDWPAVGCPSAAPCITVSNIAGFFVHGPFGTYGPHGHFLPFPGLYLPSGNTPLTDDAAWLATAHLVR